MQRNDLMDGWNKKCRGFQSCDFDPNYTTIKLSEKTNDGDKFFKSCHNKAVKMYIYYNCNYSEFTKIR